MEIRIKSMVGLVILIPEEPRRVSNKWPVIIFAVRRIVNVKGRIISLIDSIITINDNIKGVPDGIKCANKLFK